MRRRDFAAVVLAGDRGPDDPLTRAAGVCCKALVPVAGRPMLARVLATLERCPSVARRVVAGLPQRARDAAPALLGELDDAGVAITPQAAGPSASALAAVQTLTDQPPVLLTTADHALLEPAVVEDFLDRAAASGHDFVAAVVSYPSFRQRHPDIPKTVIRFSDRQLCGCNLFAIMTPRGRRVVEAWRQVDRQRKTPWKTLSLLGWTSVARFLLGRLSSDEACRRLSTRLEVSLTVVVLPCADAAIDVDSVADWHRVEKLAAVRQPPR